jgi:hypothetical protein
MPPNQASGRFYRHNKPAANAAFSLNNPRHTRINFQFAPQSQYLHVYASVENVLGPDDLTARVVIVDKKDTRWLTASVTSSKAVKICFLPRHTGA